MSVEEQQRVPKFSEREVENTLWNLSRSSRITCLEGKERGEEPEEYSVMEREIELIGEEDSCSKGAPVDVDDAGKHEKDVVIEVDDLVNSMAMKLAKYCEPSPTFTICRVPEGIRKNDHDAYNPQIVSIGPFHRQSKNLLDMEEHKWRYLDKILNRSSEDNNAHLEKYLKAIKALEPEARNCYSGSIEMGVDELTEMMVIDGCFIIQLLLQQDEFVVDDPIDTTRWMYGCIINDMLLLENQLPFFILKCLWDLIGQRRDTLRKKALTIFSHILPNELDLDPPPEEIDVLHLLHLLHQSLRPSPTTKPPSKNCIEKLCPLQLCPIIRKMLPFLCLRRLADSLGRFSTSSHRQSSSKSKHELLRESKMIPSATELLEAGVKFQRKIGRSFLEITFENGKIEMPCLSVHDFSLSFFRNLIAFEQCFCMDDSHVTSYCFLMDSLVNSARDVGILKQSDILEHMLGSNEDVALLFNKLCIGIAWNFRTSYLNTLWEEVFQHTQRRWPKWRSKMVHDYFGNPWAILSLIGAIFILILTFVQAYFAVFSYFRPP